MRKINAGFAKKNKKSINLLKSGDSQKPFSSITLKKDSREGFIVFTSSQGIVQSSGNPPTANFESNERKSSPSLKQQGMISALLRGAKPIASLDQENCATMEVSYKKMEVSYKKDILRSIFGMSQKANVRSTIQRFFQRR